MTRIAIRLDVLPAAYGDCLLIEYPVGKRTWRMLVDTGPDDTYAVLRTRLAAIAPNADGRRHIDVGIDAARHRYLGHRRARGVALRHDRSLQLS